MAQIPLGIGAYSRPFGKLPEIRMENRFFEQNPVGAEKVALLSRPGTSLFLEVGTGPIRTLYSQPGVFGGDLFIVSGTKLFRYGGGVATEIAGDVLGDGYPVITSVAIPGKDTLFITDGLTLQHYTGPEGGAHALAQSSVPDDVGIVDLTMLASFVICAQAMSRKFFWIKPGEVDIDPLDFSSFESESDEIVNVAAVGDQLWIFGQSSTEAWYAIGDLDQPFQRAQGRAFSQGILPGTLAKIQDYIVVVGQDRVAYRIRGGPERISHHGIEEMLRQWHDTSDLRVSLDYTITAQRTVQFLPIVLTSAPITSYEWDFGDTNTSTLAQPTHEYAALGSYTVSLTVTDETGRTGKASRVVNVTTLLVAPSALSGVWSRTSDTHEQIALGWTDPSPYVAALPRRVYRGIVEIADLAVGVTSFAHDTAHATEPLAGEVDNEYHVRYYEDTELGDVATLTVWSGPIAPSSLQWVLTNSQSLPADYYKYRIDWSTGAAGAITRIQDDYECSTGDRTTAAVGLTSKVVDGLPKNSLLSEDGSEMTWPVSVQLRHERTQFGVTDLSKWAAISVEVRIHFDETAQECV